MKIRTLLFAAAAISAILAAIPVQAQWLNYPTKNLPRTKDGKPDMNAPAPKRADGTPDLSGIWMEPGLKYLINVAADLKEVPFQPWAAEEYKRRMDTRGKDDPNNFCLPSGIPEKEAVTSPWKIVQTPGAVIILYESRTIFRQIFTDGRKLPADPNPTWQGYSVGHWDGDTLVTETAGTNGMAWLDTNGHPVTEALKVIEKFHRRDFGHLDLEITIDDPKAYTKPWTVHQTAEFQPDTELLEYVCEENNKDVGHFVGK
ncbi:MAG TPA: hypothetical protein VK789_01280 [Bryobacteraceae bacterium]|jgi:hypothetical protein|nr:hypothetical protein [Bryobacteraceae bacterium]